MYQKLRDYFLGIDNKHNKEAIIQYLIENKANQFIRIDWNELSTILVESEKYSNEQIETVNNAFNSLTKINKLVISKRMPI